MEPVLLPDPLQPLAARGELSRPGWHLRAFARNRPDLPNAIQCFRLLRFCRRFSSSALTEPNSVKMEVEGKEGMLRGGRAADGCRCPPEHRSRLSRSPAHERPRLDRPHLHFSLIRALPPVSFRWWRRLGTAFILTISELESPFMPAPSRSDSEASWRGAGCRSANALLREIPKPFSNAEVDGDFHYVTSCRQTRAVPVTV